MANHSEATKRVRILVAIDDKGQWNSGGYSLEHHSTQPDPREWMALDDLTECIAYHWVEADVPMPLITTVIAGNVTDAE